MEEIRVLLELQEVMAQIRQAEREKEKIPLEVADLKALFEEREAKFLAAQADFEQARKERLAKEREIEEERDKVERAKAKLMAIKTNKEYYAMLKEIDQTKRANSAREDELLEILARHEDAENRVTQFRGEAEEVGARYRERMVDIEARMATFDGEIQRLQGKKGEIASRATPALLRRFETIFTRREGMAIVAARNQSCAGCHMNLSPQLYNQLQRMDRVYACPNCNRFLYYEESPAEQTG